VTMNNAHRTHWTPVPDPRIPHVLRGWGEGTLPAEHHLDLGEMLVRNVTTDVLRGGLPRPDGNSIFVFEVAGLCIGHLGHLHHEPTPLQYALIGRLDVVMVPVDGGLTLDTATLIEVVSRFRSSVVLPMHWFSGASLERFLRRHGGGVRDRAAGRELDRGLAAGAAAAADHRGAAAGLAGGLTPPAGVRRQAAHPPASGPRRQRRACGPAARMLHRRRGRARMLNPADAEFAATLAARLPRRCWAREVAAIVRACAAARVGIVPLGGGTGLVGGQVMAEGPAPLILSLERMRAHSRGRAGGQRADRRGRL
jgi:hypothetical protein